MLSKTIRWYVALIDQEPVIGCALGGAMLILPIVPIGILLVALVIDACSMAGKGARRSYYALHDTTKRRKAQRESKRFLAKLRIQREEAERLRPQREAEDRTNELKKAQEQYKQELQIAAAMPDEIERECYAAGVANRLRQKLIELSQ